MHPSLYLSLNFNNYQHCASLLSSLLYLILCFHIENYFDSLMPNNIQTTKVMLKIFQARLQQYMRRELPDVQAGFRKGRGTRVQIANIHRITEKAIEF